MEVRSVDTFYEENGLHSLLPENISREIGHFNVFNAAEIYRKIKESGPYMPYNRRAYYKISLVRGQNKAEYADKVIEIEKQALVFATPKIPYHWLPVNYEQAGYFCIFSADFMAKSRSGVAIDELPIFSPSGFPVFQLSDEEAEKIESIFKKMESEIASDYLYKYDLLRNYVLELIHTGQKLLPETVTINKSNGINRVASLFNELLERQFPIESTLQKMELRTANDYAKQLSVHVNYLNRAVKTVTGKTTSAIIAARVSQEAKVLLKQTNWNISEIAWCLGYDEVSHFSNFFRKQNTISPLQFRG